MVILLFLIIYVFFLSPKDEEAELKFESNRNKVKKYPFIWRNTTSVGQDELYSEVLKELPDSQAKF